MHELVQQVECSVASYRPVKYSTNGLTTKSANVSSGKVRTLANRLCSTREQPARGRPGSVRRASVTGAPSARRSAPPSTAPCAAPCARTAASCRTPRCPERREEERPQPGPRKASVRPIGQRSPRPQPIDAEQVEPAATRAGRQDRRRSPLGEDRRGREGRHASQARSRTITTKHRGSGWRPVSRGRNNDRVATAAASRHPGSRAP